MHSLNLCLGGHRRPVSKGGVCRWEHIRCVLLPLRAPAHQHQQLESAGLRVLGKSSWHVAAEVCVAGWRWGANLIPLQMWVLVRLLFTSLSGRTGLTAQLPLSSMCGDPQAIASPSCKENCPLTPIPLWDTSRVLTGQTWPRPCARECCLEGKEESPITQGAQNI